MRQPRRLISRRNRATFQRLPFIPALIIPPRNAGSKRVEPGASAQACWPPEERVQSALSHTYWRHGTTATRRDPPDNQMRRNRWLQTRRNAAQTAQPDFHYCGGTTDRLKERSGCTPGPSLNQKRLSRLLPVLAVKYCYRQRVGINFIDAANIHHPLARVKARPTERMDSAVPAEVVPGSHRAELMQRQFVFTRQDFQPTLVGCMPKRTDSSAYRARALHHPRDRAMYTEGDTPALTGSLV